LPAQIRRRRVTASSLAALADAAGATLAVVVGLVIGFGWTYVFRGFGWLSFGPRVGDALPLLQLAGFDAQPLARVFLAWLLAGAVVGVALGRMPAPRRTVLALALAVPALLVASQAANAVARNLRFDDVLWHRRPGIGPWVEGLLLAVGCALAGRISRSRHRSGRS
jgi:hypothetical protein